MNDAIELEQRVRRQISAGHLHDAVETCDELNERYPEYEQGWCTASNLALMMDAPLLAVQAINRALDLSPGRPEWVLQRINCLGALGEIEVAAALAEELSSHVFDSASHAAHFGLALSRLGKLDQALQQYERACELEPEESRHFFGLAKVLRGLGRMDRAQQAIDRSLELNGDDVDAQLFRSNMRKQTEDSNHVAELEAAYSSTGEQPRKHVRVCYALAKELADIGQYERAFDYLAEGSTLRRQAMRYDVADDIKALTAVQETYVAELFDDQSPGFVNAEPIFVIGVPQSGVSGVAQVLGSHPVVHAAGALPTFSIKLVEHCEQVSRLPRDGEINLISDSTQVDFEALGRDYIEGTRPETGKTAHFVDSHAHNFLYAGLIHLALPKAKIICVLRDPMDNCFALYRSLYETGCPYSYDLGELAHYFVASRSLIEHWQAVMPGVMHVVQYDELLNDSDAVVRDILDYCSLSHEARALSAGADLQRDGPANRWRNFEKQLEPVVSALEDAGLLPRRTATPSR